ncbi:MAG: mechanosensitive ion channel [Planctomycetaceae bacterium]|jgi:small conductance mechanosensitive channel|nr:mechanosensitive ion channel [Phycisphaerales bacterium]MCE2652048.1 mechanosensitive ion channel [Planctomycetaceae bacterium]
MQAGGATSEAATRQAIEAARAAGMIDRGQVGAADVSKAAVEVAREKVERGVNFVESFTTKAADWFVTQGPAVVATLLLLVAAWFIAAWVRRLVLRGLTRAQVDLTLSKFLANLVKWAIIIFAVIACLGTFGVNTTSFAALIGAAGLAVGLALQGNLGNLASGVLLLIFRPFKIGDSVIVAGQAGVVDGIDLFTTNLDTGDNRRIVVPNSAIFSGVIENQTRHPRRRADVTLAVNGGLAYDRVRSSLLAAAERVAGSTPGVVTDQPVGVGLNDLHPAQTWTVSVWAETTSHAAVRQALLRELKQTIETDGLGAPGPSMDVRIKEMAGR